ncbi:hypothetical protein HPB48_000811 [Haemaphysalis longicornis]|uniref:Tick transposon n=1 Tax=Haemaphysalis longicornis TaxID=44386 RepID=A0A9J6FMT0_HAELO|nr:hypothetical protein HPB48_000811 [Haemaphysalis longicornis]
MKWNHVPYAGQVAGTSAQTCNIFSAGAVSGPGSLVVAAECPPGPLELGCFIDESRPTSSFICIVLRTTRTWSTQHALGDQRGAANVATGAPGSTRTGRRLLQRVGLSCSFDEEDELVPLRDDIASSLVIPPLPKNVAPGRNSERRMARACALAKGYNGRSDAVYVDASKRRDREDTYAVVAIRAATGEVLSAGSVQAKTARQAEEAAIALALLHPDTRTVFSDSKSAIANLARGMVCKTTMRVLSGIGEGARKNATTTVRWFPAHMGRELRGGYRNVNEAADAAARDLAACRAAPATDADVDEEPSNDEDDNGAEPLTTYGATLCWYRTERQAYPPPHPGLARREAVLLRQLQTGTVLTPALARHVCPDMYEDEVCSVCARVNADLAHLMWGCADHDSSAGRPILPPDIADSVRSSGREDQLRAIQRLEAALDRQRRKGNPHSPRPPPAGARARGDSGGTPSSPRRPDVDLWVGPTPR